MLDVSVSAGVRDTWMGLVTSMQGCATRPLGLCSCTQVFSQGTACLWPSFTGIRAEAGDGYEPVCRMHHAWMWVAEAHTMMQSHLMCYAGR